MKVKTRGTEGPQNKPGIYFCAHPEELELYLEPMAGELLENGDWALWYDPVPVSLDRERQEKLEGMDLFVVAVTEKLLAAPNEAMDKLIPLAREKGIPVLPILMEEGVEWYFDERFGRVYYLDATLEMDGEGRPCREELQRFLAVAAADATGEKSRICETAQTEDPAELEILADRYRMGIGVERDLKTALKLREKEARIRRAACAGAPGDPEMNRQLRLALERLIELHDELGYGYEGEERYEQTLLELEKVCRRGAEHFGQREEKRGLCRCLAALGTDHEARGAGEESVRYFRLALKTARELAGEAGELSDRLLLTSCLRSLGDDLLVAGESWRETYKEALELDRRLWEETEEISVLESLADDYWGLGQSRQGDADRETLREYREKRLEICLLLAEKTGKRRLRQEACMARARLAMVSGEREAEEQLALAEKECLRIAGETGRRADWLMVVDFYRIRMEMAWEEKEIRSWYDKAEEILEKLAQRSIPEEVYVTWLSLCADAAEILEDDDLLEKADRLRKLREECRAGQ